ncbi:MAG: hypothetical protein ABIP89_08715 [Polyangiaceae bacterium]
MRLRLELSDCCLGDLLHVGSEFPNLEVLQATPPSSDFTIDTHDWESPAWDPFVFDRELVPAFRHADTTLDVIGPGCARAALTLLTRYQRFAHWSSAHLATEALARIVETLIAPDHGLDTRAWLLRLDPGATLAAQLAALFQGVAKPDAALEELGFEPGVRARVLALMVRRSEPDGDEELELLNDAEALSFFSLRSARFLCDFGFENTRLKTSYALRRMSAVAQAHLPYVRMPAKVRELVTG